MLIELANNTENSQQVLLKVTRVRFSGSTLTETFEICQEISQFKAVRGTSGLTGLGAAEA